MKIGQGSMIAIIEKLHQEQIQQFKLLQHPRRLLVQTRVNKMPDH